MHSCNTHVQYGTQAGGFVVQYSSQILSLLGYYMYVLAKLPVSLRSALYAMHAVI